MSVPAPEAEQAPPESRIEAQLANMFGDTPEPESPPAEPQESAPQADITEESEVPESAAPEAAQELSDATDGAPEDDTETLEIETASDLASYLADEGYEIDEASLYTLKFPVKQPDGTDRLMSIGEWKDSEQERLRGARDLENLATDRERFEQERSEQVQQVSAYQAQLEAVMQQTEQLVLADLQNLQSLRESDPAEYAARSQENQARRNHLDSLKAHAIQSQQAVAAKLQAQTDAAKAQFIEQERGALMEKIPAWRDPDAMAEGQEAVTKFMLDSGFSPHEIGNILDHRLVLLAEQARAYSESMKVVGAAKKKRFTLGKRPLKPGAKQSRAEQAQDNDRQVRANLRKSGRVEDAAPLYDAALQRMGF